jgi:NitT/TauT family transport system substrate-binding protein
VEGLDTADEAIQKAVLQASLEFWRSDTPGVSQREAWENIQEVLLDMGMLSQPQDLEKAFSNEFVR